MAPSRNLFVFHLESVAWQAVRAFPEAFPNLHALMATARTYDAYFSSATSTQMVLASFLHGNDFEMDAARGLGAPARNNPSLLTTLDKAGYRTAFLCATRAPHLRMLSQFADSVPPVWSSNDFSEVIGQFETLVRTPSPFAIYVWSQVPHVIANMALVPYARHLDGLVAGACAVADNLLGALLEVLRRWGCEEATTVLVYGDHGDDFYTHGFNNGLLHAGPPHTPLVHAPLVIRDARLPGGRDERLASTVDLASTCLDLLGVVAPQPFPHSGASLLATGPRTVAFSQNLTANQSRTSERGPRRWFSANDRSCTLLAGPQGLAFHNFRMDPTNHFNILNFFNMDAAGRLTLVEPPYGAHPHFRTVRHMWEHGDMRASFAALREALVRHVDAKRAYVLQRAEGAVDLMDPRTLGRIDRTGWRAFFRAPPWAGPIPGGRLQRWQPRKTDLVGVARDLARGVRDALRTKGGQKG